MEINFKDFVVLYDKTSYESYKAACVEKLLGEGSEAIPQAMASDSTVQFPDPPPSVWEGSEDQLLRHKMSESVVYLWSMETVLRSGDTQ